MHDELGEPSEEELRAAFEEQLRQVSVEDVILQTVATFVNLGARRLGLIPEAGEDPGEVRDLAQARLAIDGARALAPLCPDDHQESIRQALSQLQLSYAREVQPSPGAADLGSPGGEAPADASAPAPATDASEAAERAKARSKIWTPPGT